MIVAIAMSGGVDSSVAALRLVEAGHRVLGLHMRLFETCRGLTADLERSCCSPDHERLARAVASRLGIDFHVVDLRDDFRRFVIEPFGQAYAQGRTPNPCAACNHDVKFAALLERAVALGADRLATGHYARLTLRDGQWCLARPRDRRKDQTYFLYGAAPEALARTLFPLGECTKVEVREAARTAGLPVHDRPESQEICFVNGEPYWAYLARNGVIHDPDPGEIVDLDGRVLGTHPGVHRFTVGQRKGFGFSLGGPRYVVRLEPATRRVVVGSRNDTLAGRATVGALHWASGTPPASSFEADVMVRYRDSGRPARVSPQADGRVLVVFESPVAAVTPGQAAVFYAGDAVVGGGVIESWESDRR